MSAVHTYASLTPGESWRSPGRTLTESELSWSCMTSGDWHGIHADLEYASATLAGQRMFHGSYGLHVALGMATRLPDLGNIVIAALGFSEWRFKKPLFVGDTVHAEVTLVGKRRTSNPATGIVERRIQLFKQDGSVAQEGILATMVRAHSDQEGDRG